MNCEDKPKKEYDATSKRQRDYEFEIVLPRILVESEFMIEDAVPIPDTLVGFVPVSRERSMDTHIHGNLSDGTKSIILQPMGENVVLIPLRDDDWLMIQDGIVHVPAWNATAKITEVRETVLLSKEYAMWKDSKPKPRISWMKMSRESFLCVSERKSSSST